jgi:hypothetical protein
MSGSKTRVARASRRSIGVAVPVVAAGAFLATSSPARADGPLPTYQALASATGIQLTYTSPGFPATDTPLNSGGPTAEVSVDSLGGSLGYAALPDPGKFVTTLPGTGAGLAAGGLAGLPPTNVPPPPNYPFFVATDATTNPTDSIGAGPYGLQSESANRSGHAQAYGGFAVSAVGNVSLATSEVRAGSVENGIVATASSDIQGLTIGPLTFGQILSRASRTLSSDGSNSPSSSLQISGMRIGGLPISLTKDQLNLPGPSYPLQMDGAMSDALKSAGITITVVSARESKTSVVAPALVITAPAAIPGATAAESRFTLTLGGAIASLTGSGGSAAVDDNRDQSVVPNTAGTTAGDGPGDGIDPATHAVLLSAAAEPADLVSAPSNITYNPVVEPTSATQIRAAPMGFGWIYLVAAAGAIAIVVLGQLIQQAGVRRLWKSGVG